MKLYVFLGTGKRGVSVWGDEKTLGIYGSNGRTTL